MHNEQVRQKEDMLKKLINCVVFLPQCAHFRGHAEGKLEAIIWSFFSFCLNTIKVCNILNYKVLTHGLISAMT